MTGADEGEVRDPALRSAMVLDRTFFTTTTCRVQSRAVPRLPLMANGTTRRQDSPQTGLARRQPGHVQAPGAHRLDLGIALHRA